MITSGDTSKYIVGLTGGIGSGKSAAARAFEARGVDVVDADAIARELVAKDSPALLQISRHFGDRVLTEEGTLDRAALRRIIFSDPAEKAWLEGLLHPLVRAEIQRRARAAASPYVLLVVPLLLENEGYDFVDRVLVVDVPEAVQIERTTERDGTPGEDVKAIIAAQLPRHQRLARADDVIDNSGSLDELEREVDRLHDFYLQQARQSGSGDQEG